MMDITWYIPNKQNFENERYSSFKALTNARPEIITKEGSKELTAYHVE